MNTLITDATRKAINDLRYIAPELHFGAYLNIIRMAVSEEREACAKIVEDRGCGYHNCAGDLSKLIRARSS